MGVGDEGVGAEGDEGVGTEYSGRDDVWEGGKRVG